MGGWLLILQGRVRPGVCYRLFTEDAFHKVLPDRTIPEMQRCEHFASTDWRCGDACVDLACALCYSCVFRVDLATVVLQLKGNLPVCWVLGLAFSLERRGAGFILLIVILQRWALTTCCTLTSFRRRRRKS